MTFSTKVSAIVYSLISPRKTIALCSALPFGGVGRLDDFFVEDFLADSSFLAMFHLLWLVIKLSHTISRT